MATGRATPPTLGPGEPVAVALVGAIRTGDVEALRGLLAENLPLATARIRGARGGSRTLLHVAADWPGHFPNGAPVVRTLVEAGAEVNAAAEGSFAETALHWAASSDDLEVAEALIAAGADLEAPGASIAGGTPLDNAVGYGCWQVARLLVERGARVYKLWHAAALGLTSQIEEFFARTPPTPDEVSDAFWQACHGGQPRAAAYLLARGANPNWVPSWSKSTPLEIAASLETRRETMVTWLRDQGVKAASDPS